MGSLTDYGLSYKQTLKMLSDLEEEYRESRKGKIYIQKKLLYSNKLNDIKRKVLLMGVEHVLVQCYFTLPNNKPLEKPTRCRMILTGISVSEAEIIIQLRFPNATEIKCKAHLPGLLEIIPRI